MTQINDWLSVDADQWADHVSNYRCYQREANSGYSMQSVHSVTGEIIGQVDYGKPRTYYIAKSGAFRGSEIWRNPNA